MILYTPTLREKIDAPFVAHSANHGRPRHFLASALLIIFTVCFIALAAAAKIEAPFRSDQSLFLLYARMLSQGYKLYVDIWDIKQPAIYWFYLASAEVFPYSERGVHLGELAWSAAFSACLILTLRQYFTHWALSPLSPLIVVGNYFLHVGATEQTQAEWLVGFPLYLCAYFCCRATERDHRRRSALLFGMSAAVACLFKMIFIVIIASFLLVAVQLRPKAGERRSADKKQFLFYASGFLIVCAVVSALLVSRHEFAGFVRVTFVYPFEA